MSEITDRLATALTDRYTVERVLGAGGMASIRDSSRNSADVTEVTLGEQVTTNRKLPITDQHSQTTVRSSKQAPMIGKTLSSAHA